MKQLIMKKLWIAGIALMAVPMLTLAQDEKDKKEKDKEVQNIFITRTGDTKEKMVIEIQGDKVTINGKDVKDAGDVKVHLNTIKAPSIYHIPGAGQGTWAFDMHGNYLSLFSEDENRAMLGVTTETHEKGARIVSVNEESGADKAGLKKGDVITRIDDKKVEAPGDVTEAIRSKKPGDKITVTFSRDGREQKATAELGKWKGIKMNTVTMPRIMEQWNMPPEPPRIYGTSVWGRPRLGLSIQDTEDGNGAKVLDVDDESAAEKAGFKNDDIIISVDGKEVKGTEDVSRAIRENREKSVFLFKVKRDGKTQDIEVKFPKRLKTTDL